MYTLAPGWTDGWQRERGEDEPSTEQKDGLILEGDWFSRKRRRRKRERRARRAAARLAGHEDSESSTESESDNELLVVRGPWRAYASAQRAAAMAAADVWFCALLAAVGLIPPPLLS